MAPGDQKPNCDICGRDMSDEEGVWCDYCDTFMCADCNTEAYEEGEEDSGWGPGLDCCPKHAPTDPRPDLRVTDGGGVISAMYVADSRSIGIAEMNLMPSAVYDLADLGEFVWWVCRVKVEQGYRRRGYGRDLVQALAKHQREHAMIVAPGGYDIPQEEQEAFYAACGFVRHGDFMVRSLA